MKITVSGREQISTATLMLYKNEDAWIEFQVDEWNLKLNIICNDDLNNNDGNFKLVPENDHAKFFITNWKGLPVSSTAPLLIGTTNKGTKIHCVLSGYAINDFKRIDISFFKGGN